MKILIIDDSIVMRNKHKELLLENNIQEENILEAKDGDRALTLATIEIISLFILDWNMPGLNGIEFTKTIRSLRQYAKTPIIMVTSEAADYNAMDAIEAGVTNYISKPVRNSELWEKIAKHL